MRRCAERLKQVFGEAELAGLKRLTARPKCPPQNGSEASIDAGALQGVRRGPAGKGGPRKLNCRYMNGDPAMPGARRLRNAERPGPPWSSGCAECSGHEIVQLARADHPSSRFARASKLKMSRLACCSLQPASQIRDIASAEGARGRPLQAICRIYVTS